MTLSLASTPAEIATLCVTSPDDVRDLLVNPEYWRGIVRGTAGESLRILQSTSCVAAEENAPPSSSDSAYRLARAEVSRDGYTGFPGFLSHTRAASLAEGSLALLRRGWPATFLLMFDEPWALARSIARTMRSAIHDELVLRYEMFVYCVDSTLPLARSRGIPPHRDAPGAGYDAQDTWMLPRHGTAWLALTDTTVDNGCIYVVPAGSETEADRSGPIIEERGIPLEVSAGTLLMWGGHVAHWGGRHDPVRARGPRIALTCVASVVPTWGLPPLDLPVDVGATALPDMATRLSFVSALLRGFGPPEPGSAVANIISQEP